MQAKCKCGLRHGRMFHHCKSALEGEVHLYDLEILELVLMTLLLKIKILYSFITFCVAIHGQNFP